MRADVRLATTIDRLVRISAGLATFLGFLVVIPLTLWFAWTHHSTLAEAIIKTLFCISFGWMMVAILGWFRSFRALGNGASSGALLTTSRVEMGQTISVRGICSASINDRIRRYSVA